MVAIIGLQTYWLRKTDGERKGEVEGVGGEKWKNTWAVR